MSKDNRISDILDKYKHYLGIQKIREHVTNRVFSFNNISINEIEDKIKNIDIEKASSDDDIPAKIIIGCSDIVSSYIREIYDKAILNCEFPALLKFADISPFHKKDLRVVKALPAFFSGNFLSKSLSQSESRNRLHNYSKFHHY